MFIIIILLFYRMVLNRERIHNCFWRNVPARAKQIPSSFICKNCETEFHREQLFFFHYGWVNSKRSHPTLPPPPPPGICWAFVILFWKSCKFSTPGQRQMINKQPMSLTWVSFIFSSRWNRFVSVFKNCCIDRTMHEVYVSFQISRKFFLVLSGSTIHAQRKRLFL